jgi:hypothetical protein
MKKYSFDFNTAGMVDFLNANADLLLHKIVMDTTEAQYSKVIPGVKYGELVPVFETGNIDTIATLGNGCGEFSTGTGTTITMSEVELKVASYQIEKSWCEADLNNTIMSVRLRPGSYGEEVGGGFEQAIMDDVSKKANVFLSRKYWGATTAVDGVSGCIEQLQSAALSGSVVNVNYSALTIQNAVDVVNQYVLNLPDPLKVVPTILWLNHGDFQAYQLGLVQNNLYHFDPVTLANGAMAIRVPFTQTIAVSCEIGAVGSYAVLTNPDNFLLGTDLLSDITSPISWYSQDFGTYRMKLVSKWGMAVSFGSQVVFAS